MKASTNLACNLSGSTSFREAAEPSTAIGALLNLSELADPELTVRTKKSIKPKKDLPAQAAAAGAFRLPELVSKESAALALGVSPGTLDVWRSTGRYALPFVKIGRKVLYKLDDLAAFIERRTRSNGTTE